MSLFGLIFYIIIIVFLINAKKAAQSGGNQKSGTELFDAIPNVPTKKKVDRTFMEPHREEARQPKIRTNNLWGEDEHAKQRIVALRLMEGDPVPGGYEKIRCPYCGADNLVTKHCKEYHSCYFCRVPID